MTKTLTLFLLLLLSAGAFSQRHIRDSAIATPWIGINYGANLTAGDFADRFGFTNHLGAMAGYKTAHNWVYGMDGNFIFGSKIRGEDILAGLRDSYGNITDENGDVGTAVISQRGFNINLMIGKVFPVFSPNENSGIYVHGGAGYLQHRMKIETQDQVIPSIELLYRKGYDRFTTGLNLHQFLGYAYMGNNGAINFYGGFYIMEGFTKNRREVFFDQPDVPVSTATRLDIMYGLKAGWFIPVYKRKPKEFYFD